MVQLLIIYHTRTGGSQQMAEAAADAARDEADVRLLRAEDAAPDDLLTADGYIFCAPENLADSGHVVPPLQRCCREVRSKGQAAFAQCGWGRGIRALQKPDIFRLHKPWDWAQICPEDCECNRRPAALFLPPQAHGNDLPPLP